MRRRGVGRGRCPRRERMPGPGGRLRNTRSEGTGGTLLAREDLGLSPGAGRSGLKVRSTRPQRRSKPPKRGAPTGSRIKNRIEPSRPAPPRPFRRNNSGRRNREDDDARLPFARETRRGRPTPGAAPSLLRGHRRYRRADAAALRPRGLRTVLPAAGLPARRALPRRLRPALPVRGAGGVRRSSPKRHARDPPLLEPPARARTGGGAASPLSWTGWGRVE